MREGPEKHEVLQDELIVQFGAEMLEKLAHVPNKDNNIKK